MDSSITGAHFRSQNSGTRSACNIHFIFLQRNTRTSRWRVTPEIEELFFNRLRWRSKRWTYIFLQLEVSQVEWNVLLKIRQRFISEGDKEPKFWSNFNKPIPSEMHHNLTMGIESSTFCMKWFHKWTYEKITIWIAYCCSIFISLT